MFTNQGLQNGGQNKGSLHLHEEEYDLARDITGDPIDVHVPTACHPAVPRHCILSRRIITYDVCSYKGSVITALSEGITLGLNHGAGQTSIVHRVNRRLRSTSSECELSN